MKGVQERLEFGKQSPGLFQEVPRLDETRVHPHWLGLHPPCWLPSGLTPTPSHCLRQRTSVSGPRVPVLLGDGAQLVSSGRGSQEGWEEVLPVHMPHS